MLRDPVDVLRTRFWYEGLCIRLGVTTAYALEKRIEPGAFKKNDDNISIRRNKWGRYRSGLHTPNKATCALADRIVAGSSAELNHVLWKSLSIDSPVSDAWNLLRELSPDLQLILFEGPNHFRIYGGSLLLRKIEHRAGFEALACLTLLLRINYEAGQHDRVWEFANSIMRMLLILGKVFADRGLARELFAVYCQRIFNLAKWKGKRYYLYEYDYVINLKILYIVAHNTNQTKGRRLEWHEKVKFMRRILDGRFGFDLKFIFELPTGPDLDIGPPTYKSISGHKQDMSLRARSHESLFATRDSVSHHTIGSCRSNTDLAYRLKQMVNNFNGKS